MSQPAAGGAAGQAPRRVCVVGDDLVAGVGDPKALGWVGRVTNRTGLSAGDAVFALGVPGESTGGLLHRWREETGRRWAPGADNRLVLGLGAADVGEDISLARSRLNVANVLDEAQTRRVPVLVVGPPPGPDPAVQGRARELAEAFGDVCARRGVTYVDCFAPLTTHEQWFGDLAASDGHHPGQVGYGLLAWLVMHGGWYEWLGVPRP